MEVFGVQSQYYKNLGSAQRYYDQALRCFQTQGRTFPVENVAETGQMVQHILADHPEIFYVGQRVGMRASLLKAEAFVDYTYSPSEVTQITTQLEEAADSIIREQINDYQSDYDKVRVLHDYLKCNLEYDVMAAGSTNLNDCNIAQAHSIVGALLNHKCVCDGFSKALKYLCDRISVECWVVCGSGNSLLTVGPHAWNIVKINGYYHHVDVTWDNQYSDSAAMPNYGYHAGGVVANVVVVMGAVVLMTVGHQLIKLLALTLLVSGCMKLVGNCWPHIEKDSPNDGYILRLLKNDPEVQHDYLTYITLYAALFWGEMVCAEDYSYGRHTTEEKRLLFYEEIQTLLNVLRDASISTPE